MITKINLRKMIPERKRVAALVSRSGKIAVFISLLLSYFSLWTIDRIFKIRIIPEKIRSLWVNGIKKKLESLIDKLDRRELGSIKGVHLIELSIKNMQAKKTRSIVTIGGMSIGVGAIVFLVSVGYGLQNLVITRMARLEEMKQADVTPQTGAKVKIDDKTLADFKEISGISQVLPMISVVGRVNFQNSVSDMAVYAVTTDYLEQSAIKPVVGKLFESNDLSVPLSKVEIENKVAGVTTSREGGGYGWEIGEIEYSIEPESWVRVRLEPNTKSEVLGYTKRSEGVHGGWEYWGEAYDAEDGRGRSGTDGEEDLGKWVRADFKLWIKDGCRNIDGCTDGYREMRNEEGSQVEKNGYTAEIKMQVNQRETIDKYDSKVLGLTSEDLGLVATDEAWLQIASESGLFQTEEIKKVDISDKAVKQAVVNRAMLKVLGLKEDESVGKTFEAVFVVAGSLLGGDTKAESNPTLYTIVGVIPDDRTPIFYVPFMDIRSVGVVNYSQIKVVVTNQNALAKARKQIETLGFVTRSVTDTVAQINSLFATVRTMLALLGMVALAVASLGMFNTLTVSLLERTREVGLMKAMGMKSSEVQELFLTESMMMGFFGGLVGILFGFLAGKLLGVLLSIFSITKGLGIIDISYIPLGFLIVVVILSLVVGILTGLYPAKRATKISALNALRYE